LENGLETPVVLWSRMLNVAGVSIPKLKFIVRVLPASDGRGTGSRCIITTFLGYVWYDRAER
jgi:hypothetical protein